MQEGPFKTAIEASADNVIKQEFVTYYVNAEGATAKRTAERRFFNDDYVDSSSTEILVLAEN
jgi:hypothetical protein